MRRRSLVIVLVLALLCFGAFVLVRVLSTSDDRVEIASLSPATTSTAESEPKSERAQSPLEAPAAPNPERQVAVASAPSKPTRAPAPNFDPSKFVLVRVVDHATGDAIEGAEMRTIDRSQTGFAFEDLDCLLVELRDHGRALRSGPDGRVLVPHSREFSIVSARSGESWGLAEVSSGIGERELRVHRDPTFEMTVTDRSGAPIGGVPLVMHDERSRLMSFSKSIRARSRTSDGRAIFSHGGWWIDSEPGPSFDIAADAVLANPEKAGLDGFPRMLPLPDGGSVEVRVLDLEGKPAGNGAFVTLRLDPASPNATERSSTVVRKLASGTAEFEYVEVGQDLVASATLEGGLGPFTLRVPGPTERGKHVVVEVPTGAICPQLVGRALDGDRRVLANAKFEVQLPVPPTNEDPQIPSTLATDAQGAFRLPLAHWPRPSTGRLRFVHWPGSGEPLITALVDVTSSLAPGENSLGDVVLEGLPLIASGRVVDERGQPQWGVLVNVLAERDGGAWQQTPSKCETNRTGQFAIMSEVEGDALALIVNDVDCLPSAVVPIARGAKDVVLTVARAGRIQGKVVVDPDVTVQEINLTWCVANAQTGEPTRTTFLVKPDGGARDHGLFDLRGAMPGRGSLEIRGVSTPIRTIDELYVNPGAPCADPRVAEIDLRGGVHAFNLTIRNSNRKDVDGDILFRAAASNEPWQHWPFQRGRARVLATARALDLVVSARLCRTTWFEGVSGDRELTLAPPMTIEVDLTDPASIPPPFQLVAVVEPAGETLSNAAWPLVTPFDSSGRAVFHVPEPMALAVHLKLRYDVEHGFESLDVSLASPRILDIRDVPGTQRFDLNVPHQWIERLMRGAAKKR